MFSNIPDELKSYVSWVVWRLEEVPNAKPNKMLYNVRGFRKASPTDPTTWTTFEEATGVFYNMRANGYVPVPCMGVDANDKPVYQSVQETGFHGIGFVLSKADPYTIIDLDDAGSDKAAGDRQQLVYNEFVSYSEYSPSGVGCHIIVRGTLPAGRRRSKIEMYSDGRFMTMTGNVIRQSPVNDCQNLLNALYEQMGSTSTYTAIDHEDAAQTMDDEDVVQMATNASNGELFQDLHEGNWQSRYESQSEADLAYVNIIAFYTQNREQIKRMFNDSPLGARKKQTSINGIDYVNYMINKSFDKMLPPLDMDGLRNRIEEFLAKSNQQSEALKPSEQFHTTEETISEDQLATAEEVSKLIGNRSVYSVPPGLMGEIAQYIYNSAPRPVPEIALAGALGLMAGICGRAYNTNTGSGLNTYTLLLAETGRGKEAIASGVDELIGAVSKTLPQSTDIIGPGDIASAQALLKYMSKGKSSFVSIVGEFGIYLKNMAAENASPHMQMLKRTMLDLYNKSGEGKVVRPSIYADSDKNTTGIAAPNFCVIGESTPHTFYSGLTDDMIREGLLSRFTIIEYDGPRVALNPNARAVRPPMNLIDDLSRLCAYAQALNVQNKSIRVQMDSQAQWIMDQFELYCTAQINNASTDSEKVLSELWNRAHLKALRISAQVAVGCNMIDPCVSEYMANWAINIVVEDARNIMDRFRSGEIATSNAEQTKLNKLADTMKHYIEAPWSKICPIIGANFSKLHAARIIPYSFLSRKLVNIACFKNEPRGATPAIKDTIRTMIERGDIQEVSRATLATEYDCRAACYVVANTSILA